MLFDPSRHEPLGDATWHEASARTAIADIVDCLERDLGAGVCWPWHPLDETRNVPRPKTVYLGSAGTLGAMAYLQREGAARLGVDPAALIQRIYRAYLDEPDTGKVVPSFFLGEVGLLAVHWRLAPSHEVAERLEACIRANISNPANEALWAAPGTVVAALHLRDWTGERRWERLFHENAEYLFSLWLPSKFAPCHIWTQDLYGEIVQLVGAGHGFAGNVYPLLRGAAMLRADQRAKLLARCEETLATTAVVDGDRANWPPHVGPSRHGRGQILVQWCHGAPGIVTSLAHFPVGHSSSLEDLMIKAGNTIWEAGPLAKGFGLCHGTAGNGYAFLELYRRTRNSLWLDRARAFAMHAIGQAERMREKHAQMRHTLWTGDPGLAVYLWHCVKGDGALPSLESL